MGYASCLCLCTSHTRTHRGGLEATVADAAMSSKNLSMTQKKMDTENKSTLNTSDSCPSQNDKTENQEMVETAETPLVQQPKIETIVKIKSEDESKW